MPSGAKPYQYITISAVGNPNLRVLLDGQPKITQSGAKWETVDRRRRTGMTVFRGRDPVEQTIGVLFDGYIDSRAVDQDIATLDRMSRPTPSGSQPPIIHLAGAVLRKDITNWIIGEAISWGDNVIKEVVDGSPVTLRQDAVIIFREYVPPDRLELPGNQSLAPSNTKTPAKNKFHTVQKGETLTKIAVEEYGDHTRWRDIAKANNIRDPNHPPVGKRLRLP